MMKRWRGPAALGAVAITACVAVDLVALVIGTAAAASVAVVLDPLAGLLLASAIGLAVVMLIRRHRRKGARCGAAGCARR